MAYFKTDSRAGSGIDPRRLREAMVRNQIESRGVSNPDVLAAMRTVPRHQFVQPALALHAYDDTALPIGYGQTISQPFIVARMCELLEPEPGMRVLEVGSGCGYQAAILSTLGCSVYGIERVREIYQQALRRMRALGLHRVHLHCGDGTLGLATAAPFDRIIVSAGGPEIPKPLLGQLADGGILLIPVGAPRHQRLMRARKSGGRIQLEDFGAVIFVDLVGSHGW